MAYKIALNAGHGINTAGKRCMKSIDPNETREWTLNSRICNKIEEKLKAYEGYELIRCDDTSGKVDHSISTRAKKANNFKADFYLAIHHNAGIGGGSGGGIEAYVYTKVDTATKEWQKAIYDGIIKHTGLKGNRSQPLRAADFGELRETAMAAVLVECGYMDSTTDTPIILTDKFADQVAAGCVEALVAKGRLTKKATPVVPVPNTSAKTYSVLTAINKYASSSDAKAKKNSKGKFVVGTYYIFNKYPNGYNGMYNITTDKTGNSAGSWINPAENIVTAVATVTPKIKVGSTVKLNKGAKTYTGGNIASFVYNRNHKVKEIKGDRVVITYLGIVVAAVNIKDLTLA